MRIHVYTGRRWCSRAPPRLHLHADMQFSDPATHDYNQLEKNNM